MIGRWASGTCPAAGTPLGGKGEGGLRKTPDFLSPLAKAIKSVSFKVRNELVTNSCFEAVVLLQVRRVPTAVASHGGVKAGSGRVLAGRLGMATTSIGSSTLPAMQVVC
ncbi:hypothetical protein NL676_001837 [Syzygium grande]|nr:hypothetical protein NL676_001837 [Syzygium grande]